jgi:hypothetical protein
VCHQQRSQARFHETAKYRRISEMSRYFFDVVCEGTAYRDVHGQDFANPDGAKFHAAMIARELARHGSHYGGYSVCIVDEQRKEWGRVSVGTRDG